MVSPVSREDPLSEKKGRSRALKLLALLRTHPHTPHPSGGSEGPSAEGQGAIRTSAPGTHDGKNPRILWFSPLPTAHSLHSQPLWPFTGFQAPLLQPPEVPAGGRAHVPCAVLGAPCIISDPFYSAQWVLLPLLTNKKIGRAQGHTAPECG